MQTCLWMAVLLGTAPLVWAGDTSEATTSTVRADRRSGRLVRRIVVPDHVVTAKVIAPGAYNGAAPAPAAPIAASKNSDVSAIVDDVAGRHGVDPLLVHAIIKVESAYDRLAISPKGAEGLMQLMPATGRHYGVRNSFDSRQNIEGGVRYLKDLTGRFSDARQVIAAYNAGEGAVAKYGGIPPYEETQEYVYRVGRQYGELRRAQRTVVAKAQPPTAVKAPAVPEHRPVESFVDQEGRIHLRTR